MNLPIQKLKEVVMYELEIKKRERKFLILFFRIEHISFSFYEAATRAAGHPATEGHIRTKHCTIFHYR
jgi:hypothetical protein